MYNDADIEMMELEAAGNEASRAHRKYKGNPISDEALQAVRDAAYHAAFYFCPVFEAVIQTCHDYEIDIEDARVQDAWWRGQVAGNEAE